LLATVLVTLAAAGPASAGQAAPPAPALGGVRIVAIYFDPPGPDNRTNRSLNGEWVQLRNVTGSRKVITGWTLHDASIHRYTFPPTVMGPGARLRVHTGFGVKNPWNRYWRSANYIWNNTGDRATLRNARGTIVSRCAYTKANDPIKHC
jgi:hypothetical protein